MINFTDTSGFGISRYHMKLGLTWNMGLPKDILTRTSINYLKFLAFIVYLLVLEFFDYNNREYILFWLDNLTAVCWLKY